jgi:hypothetical protein
MQLILERSPSANAPRSGVAGQRFASHQRRLPRSQVRHLILRKLFDIVLITLNQTTSRDTNLNQSVVFFPKTHCKLLIRTHKSSNLRYDLKSVMNDYSE